MASSSWRFVLPYRRFEIVTPLSPEEAARALGDATKPGSVWWGFGFAVAGKPFRGTCDERGFEIRRVPLGRGSFVPRIRGGFAPVDRGGCRVSITIELDWFTWLFPVIWLAGTGLVSPESLTRLIHFQSAPTELLGVFAFVVIYALLVAFSLWREVRKSRRFLLRLFKASGLEQLS